MVTHVHGAHTTDDSDGFTEAWYLPAAKNIPAGYATRRVTMYDGFKPPNGSRTGDRNGSREKRSSSTPTTRTRLRSGTTITASA